MLSNFKVQGKKQMLNNAKAKIKSGNFTKTGLEPEGSGSSSS